MSFYYQNNYGDDVLELEVDSFGFDGDASETSDSRFLDLTNWSDADWSSLKVEGTVTVADSITEVFPDRERQSRPAKLLLAVDCPDIHSRFGKLLSDEPLEAGDFSYELEFDRGRAYGTIRLTPVAVLANDIYVDTFQYATYEGQRVADGDSAEILLDDLGQDRGGELRTVFKSFSETEVPDENIYHVHRTGAELPHVWINEEHKLTARVLRSEGPSGFTPYLRKVVAPWIAMDVNIQLIEWAIMGAEDNECDKPWQEHILNEYGERLYDRTNADNPGELHRLYKGETGDDPHFLRNVIEEIVQKESGISSGLEKFIERKGPNR
jgi:hypothetical protein